MREINRSKVTRLNKMETALKSEVGNDKIEMVTSQLLKNDRTGEKETKRQAGQSDPEEKPKEESRRIIPVGANGMNIWENVGLKEIEGRVYENILENISKDIVDIRVTN